MSQHESGPLCCLCGQKLALKEAAEPQAPCPSVGVPRAAKSQFSGIPTPHPSPGRSRHTSHTHATHTQASGFTLILSFFPFCQKGPKRFYQVNKSDVFYFSDCIQTGQSCSLRFWLKVVTFLLSWPNFFLINTTISLQLICF